MGIKNSAHSYQVNRLCDGKADFLSLYLADQSYYPALLETPASSIAAEHFDILFVNPLKTLVLNHQWQLESLNGDSELSFEDNDFLNGLNALFQDEQQKKLRENKTADKSIDFPFRGGWFVFLSYELAEQVEPVLKLSSPSTALPIAYATRFQSALIYSHQEKATFLVSEEGVAQEQIIEKIQANLKSSIQVDDIPKDYALSDDNPQRYLDSVARIKDYIVEGDVFQVNLSRQWQVDFKPSQFETKPLSPEQLAASVYARLRKKNPAPFAGLASIGQASIISSSPERLIRVYQQSQGQADKSYWAESRPIAGTRPRSENEQKDNQYKQQLHRHPKEQAEHIMLIDLIRNDLGRICVPGSIEANELMINESYTHVHHIVSNVRGQLADASKPGDVIRAIFPGGTITGCPKVRCMEIIAEQEQCARNAYTGSMGYLNLDGTMDLNILIRSMVLDQQEADKPRLSFRAGAGLVADSNAEHELKETRTKALGLLRVFA